MLYSLRISSNQSKSRLWTLTSKAGWKAETEHGPNVTLHWIGKDSLLQTQNSLIHKTGHQPVLNI